MRWKLERLSSRSRLVGSSIHRYSRCGISESTAQCSMPSPPRGLASGSASAILDGLHPSLAAARSIGKPCCTTPRRHAAQTTSHRLETRPPPVIPRPSSLDRLLTEVRACTVCAPYLPLGPRPVVQVGTGARILIVGQAPGTRVHASGIPWNDPSGERLRRWLGVDAEQFYNASTFAIIPMGFCYPGRGPSGDNPPRRECAELWLDKLLGEIPEIRLTLLIGQYAQRHFLGARRKSSLTETVRAWAEYGPAFIPLPHPSPRNQVWFKRHPWFESDVLPTLRGKVETLIGDHGTEPTTP
jgi:uracil-DNA glycosylase